MAARNPSRLTKTLIENLSPRQNEYTVWEQNLRGFGVRVRPSGSKSFVYFYRAGTGRKAPQRRHTIGRVQKLTVEQARDQAKKLSAVVTQGRDPASERNHERTSITVSDLIDSFLQRHVAIRRKSKTAKSYGDALNRIVRPRFGSIKAAKLSRSELVTLHHDLRQTPFQANRVVAVIGSMYTYADRAGLVPEGTNPARKIEKYREARRERFLSEEELQQLGIALKEAETVGIPWSFDETKETAKHLPKVRRTIIGPHAIAAIRLLIFTGARLREILDLRWENVDFERGLLLLPDSKTGRKTIVLNAPARAVLASLPRTGPYVIAGKNPDKPRADINKPWRMIAKRAGLTKVRIHDLRHTHASYGAAAGLGLPIIGKLLGHTQASTTQRYAHLDNDPLKRASETIGSQLANAMGDIQPSSNEPTVVPLKRASAG